MSVNKNYKHLIIFVLTMLTILSSIFFGSLGEVNAAKLSSSKTSKIKVVASVDFYGEAAKAVLGNKGIVTSVIKNPSIDPHDYQPTSNVAKKVSEANFVLYNGIGYDTWMTKLAKNSKDVVSIRVGEDLLGKKDGDNPHLWYQSKTMPKLANYLAKRFGEVQPKNKKYFQKNAKKFVKSLKPIQSKIKQLSKNSKGKLVDVSEPVFDYTLKELGYEEHNTHFAKSVEDSTDPSPKDIKAMQNDVKNRKIAFFVENTQATDKIVGNIVKIAKAHNVPVLKVTETMPKGKTYKEWMMDQLNQLEKIQKQEK
ncbi:metal ABC transporter solute-binding protein [Oenococcus oeni]|uniref:Metal ABC transporter substrate-binding protein n=1 Tax=Oenococcus oeni TaxID=1247 RepID=A0AAJ2UAZ3_OENOE|nr:metal ABC transporter solute-binding protein [Oenococcus oeni]MDV7714576.1 metal ABC transporter substrate-binding protein [Oenococcus oeni]